MVALCVVKYEKCRGFVVVKKSSNFICKKPPISYEKGGFLGPSDRT